MPYYSGALKAFTRAVGTVASQKQFAQKPWLIVGAGPAGLTLARSLVRQGRHVQVFDSECEHRGNRGLGLWGRSRAVLSHILADEDTGPTTLGVRPIGSSQNNDGAMRSTNTRLMEDSLRCPAAAYRSREGVWLSESRHDCALNRERVMTVLESEVLEALEAGLPEGAVQRGKSVVAVQHCSNFGNHESSRRAQRRKSEEEGGREGVVLTFDDGSTAEGIAVIGADGVHSTIRRLLLNTKGEKYAEKEASAGRDHKSTHSCGHEDGTGSATDAPSTGFSQRADISCDDPNTDAQRTGFCSHSGILLPIADDKCPSSADGVVERVANVSYVRESVLHKVLARVGSPYPLPSRSSFPSCHAFETLSEGRRFAFVPLGNGGAFWFATYPLPMSLPYPQSHEDKMRTLLRELQDAYKDWHDPIPLVLELALGECDVGGLVERNEPLASIPRFEVLYQVSHLDRWYTKRTNSGTTPAAVLVGDAAHGLPINLAQGAAAAIEGAFLLSEAIQKVDPHNELGDPTDPRLSPSTAEVLERGFAMYQSSHEARVKQCRDVTRFTSLLAEPASSFTESIRNLSLRSVPQPLNGYIFDTFLSYSLGDFPRRTRQKWPIETHVD